jgi:hypothetical protein
VPTNGDVSDDVESLTYEWTVVPGVPDGGDSVLAGHSYTVPMQGGTSVSLTTLERVGDEDAGGYESVTVYWSDPWTDIPWDQPLSCTICVDDLEWVVLSYRQVEIDGETIIRPGYAGARENRSICNPGLFSFKEEGEERAAQWDFRYWQLVHEAWLDAQKWFETSFDPELAATRSHP